MSAHGHGGPPPQAMPGHKIGGWVCSECGVLAPTNEVVPEFRVVRDDAGELVPVLLIWADDRGHRQQITLGWENLGILVHQAAIAQAENPDGDMLDDMPPDVAIELIEGVRRARRLRGEAD